MCGIAGIVDLTTPADAPAREARALAMRARLRHRGPDGEGLWSDAHAVLAHTRLAVLDVVGGAQPMTSADGRYVIVYNGELSNAGELKAALGASAAPRTRSDTELVLLAYERWGDACVERLSGMFAFFVWDARSQRGLAARDRLGVKPLFYAREGSALVFASEAHAIARTRRARPRADTRAVLDVLVAPCFSGVDRAMFEGVAPLLPGHVLTIDRRGLSVRRWWRWPAVVGRELIADPAEAIAALREAFTGAAERWLEADVPIDVFSSGGLDSTALAAILARTARARGGPAPRAYTVTFDDQSSFDYARSTITNSNDTPFALAAAEELGLDARLVHVSRSELARDLERVAVANDALPAWEQEIAQHRLARAAHDEGTKVVIVGDAADETHYGYHFLLDAEALRGPHVIVQRLGSVPIRRDVAADPVGDAVRALVGHVEEAGGSFDVGGPGGLDAARLAATTLLVVERWLPRLLHNGDAHTMRASVEARVPFADARLVEVASRIDPRVALHGGVEKWALREATRGLVPEAIRTRKKSALPKDLESELVLRAELARVDREPPSLVESLVDLDAMRALAARRGPLLERERAAAFRVICLAHWARHHDVGAP